MDLLAQLAASGLATGATIALSAVGFTLIHAATGIFHLAHAACLLAATYTLYGFGTGTGLPLVVVVVLAALVAAVLGAAIDTVVYRPLERRAAAPMTLVLASLAVFILLANATLLVAGGSVRAIEPGLATAVVEFAGLRMSPLRLVALALLAVLLIAGWLSSRHTTVGQTLQAVMDNRRRAETIGIDVAKVRLAVFAGASALLAVPALIVTVESGITPGTGFEILLLALTAAVIGGLGSPVGAVLGGILLGLVQSLSSAWVPGQWRVTIIFAVLVVVMSVRPRGLVRR